MAITPTANVSMALDERPAAQITSWFSPDDVATEPFRLLEPDGSLNQNVDLGLSDQDHQEMFRLMLLTRRLDEEAGNLQRQGQLGVYTPSVGQEGIQAGVAQALEPTDWFFPSYRELAIMLSRGISCAEVLSLYRGTHHGGAYSFRARRTAPYCIPIATHMLHAVGFAIGAKLDGASLATLVAFGDGATSEGDFHEACNFAGVWNAPVVFLCQNNQYAISVPLEKQTAAPALAVRAIGYGFPGIRVDGNDVLASYVVARTALHRARTGEGPTLIEAVTYRIGPHSTADDPSRYRSTEELERWAALDPISRYELFLRKEEIIGDDFHAACVAEAQQEALALRASIVDAPAPDPRGMLEHVYAEMPPRLRQQAEEISRQLSEE